MNSLELVSKLSSDGVLELSLAEVEVKPPGPDEVVVKVQAAPINPSDLGLLLGPVDPATVRVDGERTLFTVPEKRLAGVKARLDQALRVGNEGAGIVVEAGANAKHLANKTVAIFGNTWAQYKTLDHRAVVELPAGVTAAQGAAIFVNPLTSLAMTEVMKREGHHAIVHTAAASNLGQMLVKICAKDGIPLVNIVRKTEQAALLKELGATHVVDSTSPQFTAELAAAVEATGATLAFDAIGGGPLVNQILHAMEAAQLKKMTAYNRYGSPVHKQVYIYGMLDPGPTQLDRNYGFAWGVSSFLITPYLAKLGADAQKLRARIMAELTTTFASHYTATISLREALQPAVIARYGKRATGEKFLIDPSK
jgi:NADPH:quinone reductase-like Zn-dependent oxidoreductase